MATPPFTPLITSGGTLSYVPSITGLAGAYSTGDGVYNASVISSATPTFIAGGLLDITYRLNVAGSPDTRVGGVAEIGIGFTQNPVPAAWVHDPLVITYPVVSAGAYATGRATLAWGPSLSPPVFDILDIHYPTSGGAKSSGISTVAFVQNVYRPVAGGIISVRYQVDGGAAGSGEALTLQYQGVKVSPPVAGGTISASYLPSGGAAGRGSASVTSSGTMVRPPVAGAIISAGYLADGGASGRGRAIVTSSANEVRLVADTAITAEYPVDGGALGDGGALVAQQQGPLIRPVSGAIISAEYQIDGGAAGGGRAAVTSSVIEVRLLSGGTISAVYLASGGAAGGGSGFAILSEAILRPVAGGVIDIEYPVSGGSTGSGRAAVTSSMPMIRPVAGGTITIEYPTSGGAVGDGEAPFINQSGAMIRPVPGGILDVAYPVSGGAVWGGKATVLSDAIILRLVSGGALDVDFPVSGGGAFPESDTDVEGVFPGARVYQQSGPMLRLVTDAPVSQSYFPDGEHNRALSGSGVYGVEFVGSPFTPTLVAGGPMTMVVVASGRAKGNGAAKWQRLNYPTSTVTGGGIAGGGSLNIHAGMPREIIRDEVIYIGGDPDEPGDFTPKSDINMNASLGSPGGSGAVRDSDNENTGGQDEDVILGEYEVEGAGQDKLDGTTITTVLTYKDGIITIVVVPSSGGKKPGGPPPQISVTLSGEWPPNGGKPSLVFYDDSAPFDLPPIPTGGDTIFLGIPLSRFAGNKDWNLADFLTIRDMTTGGGGGGGGIYNPFPAPGQSSFIFPDLGLHANLLSSTCSLDAYVVDHIAGRLPFLGCLLRDVPDGIYGQLTLLNSSVEVMYIVIEAELPLMECEIVGAYGFIETELPLIESSIDVVHNVVEAELTLLDSILSDVPDGIYGALPLIESSIDVMYIVIEAELPLIECSIEGWFIEAELPLIECSIEGWFIEAELPLIECSIEGWFIEAELPLIECSVDVADNIDSIDGYLTLVSSSIVAVVAGIINTTLPLVSTSINAIAGVRGNISAQLTPLACSIQAIVGVRGNITASLTHLSGILVIANIINTRLPVIRANLLDAGVPMAMQQVVLVNTQTTAISTYEGYVFNSYCAVGGVYFGASAAGLYQIDTGNDDDGQPISAGVGTGIMTFGSPMQKRLTDAFATMRSNGGITLKIKTDETARQAAVSIPMIPRAVAGHVKYRGILPKGLRGKSWQFELENVGGSQFEFTELGIVNTPVLRRV